MALNEKQILEKVNSRFVVSLLLFIRINDHTQYTLLSLYSLVLCVSLSLSDL